MDVRFKRGTTAQNNAHIGRNGTVTIDTEAKQFRLHDGVTPGGMIISPDQQIWIGTREEYDALIGTSVDVLYILRPSSGPAVIDLYDDTPGPDTQAPTVPSGLSLISAGAYTVMIEWNASTDNVGVVGYELSVNSGAAIIMGSSLTYVLSNLTPNTQYSLRIRSYDAAGNRSAYTTALVVTTSNITVNPGTLKLLTFNAANDGDPDYIYTTLEDSYLGAYRMQEGGNAAGSTYDAAGAVTYNPDADSYFFAGHYTELCIAEYEIPDIVNSTIISNLNTGVRLQNYITTEDKRAGVDVGAGLFISGLHYHDNALLVNVVRVYNQGIDYPYNSIILSGVDDLDTSTATPWIPNTSELRASGWVSPVPLYLQELIGSTHITGMSSSTFLALEHDSSNGPSLWGIDANAIVEDRATITSIAPGYHWDYFPYENAIGGTNANDGRYNVSPRFPNHENKLWTFLSRVTCAMIIPGTRTFAAFGGSGGHRNGLSYYAPPWGNQGHNPLVQYDTDTYYWLFDLNVVQQLQNNELSPEDVMPYEYGPITNNIPFQRAGAGGATPTEDARIIVGGFIRGSTNEIHLAIERGDTETGGYDAPIFAVYKFVDIGTGVIIEQTIDLSQWLSGQDGVVRGNDPGGLLGSAPVVLRLLTLELTNINDPDYIYLDWDGAYVGAGRLEAGDFTGADNNLSYSPATIGLRSTTNGVADRLIIAGHSTGEEWKRLGEFEIPAFSTSNDINTLPIGDNTQNFINALDSAPFDDDEWALGKRVSGIYVDNGRVMVSTYGFYDDQQTVTQTLTVLDNATALSTTNQRGFFRGTDVAHASGWISPIPSELQETLGGNLTFGFSSGDGRSRIERFSVGPSAYIYDSTAANSVTGSNPIANGSNLTLMKGMDFPLATPMNKTSLLDEPGDNWTHLSEACYGFIVPGTRTYMVVGFSGGHVSGIDYGVPPYDSGGGSGYHPTDPDDLYNYLWFFDVDDIIAARNGVIDPHSIQPYEHGPLTVPFGESGYGSLKAITGGAFDPESNKLYLALRRADTSQATESAYPLILCYDMTITQPTPEGTIVSQMIDMDEWVDGQDGMVRGDDPLGLLGGDPGEYPLYTLSTPGAGEIGGTPTYVGAFIPTDGGIIGDIEAACWDDRCAISVGSQSNRIFLTGKQQSNDSGPAIAEVTVPTLVAGTNINALNVATVTQPFKLHSGVLADLPDNPRILNISNINNQVIIGAVNWYDAGGGDPHNFAVYENAANLNTGGMTGMFQVTGARHNAGWVIPIPAEFQGIDKLPFTHLSGMGGGISIISTTVAGISFYGVNAADILNATTSGQAISATALCDHYENTGSGMGGNLYTSTMWNFLSSCAAAFFVPGTRTIMCIGLNWGGQTSIIYKENNEDGVYGDGYQAFGVQDYRNWAWLFDVNDLIAVAQGQASPSSVLPYWNGALPDFPFANRSYGANLIGGGFLHPVTNQVYFSYQRGATARFGASPTVGVFELAGVPVNP